jgi:hypothetical protein
MSIPTIITPFPTQTIIYGKTTSYSIPSSISNSNGTISYYLSTSGATSYGNSSVNSSGVVTINNIGTINIYVKQLAIGNYTAVNAYTLAGTINVLTNIKINNSNYANVDLADIFAPYVSGTKASISNMIVNGADLNELFQRYQSGFTTLPTNLSVGANDLITRFSNISSTLNRYPPAGLTSNATTLSGYSYGNGRYTVTASFSRNNSANNYVSFGYNDGANGWQLTGVSGAPRGFYYGGASSMTTNDVIPKTYTQMEWLQIAMPQPIILKAYGIANVGINEVSAWAILASNNSTQWYRLSEYDRGSNYHSNTTLIVNLPNNTTSYSQYRFIYLKSPNAYPILMQLKLYS